MGRKGQIPWNKGTKMSSEFCRKTSIGHLGQRPWNKGLTKEDDGRISQYAVLLTGRHYSKETKDRLREVNLGKIQSAETKEKKRLAGLGKTHTEETKRRLREITLEKYQDKEYTEKRVKAFVLGMESFYGDTDKVALHNTRTSNAIKKLWQNPDYVSKQIKARIDKPSGAEQKLMGIIERNNLPYKYVGDGELIIGGRCPDFININGKKQLIELFGTYWHPIFDVAQRTEHYRQYGFNTLIIWEDELVSEDKVTTKIRRFTRQRIAGKNE